MIVPKNSDEFLTNIFARGLNARSFLVTGGEKNRDEFISLLQKYLWCESKTYCKKCARCLSKINPPTFLWGANPHGKDLRAPAAIRQLTGRGIQESGGMNFDIKIYAEDELKLETAREIRLRSQETSWAGAKIFLIKNVKISPDAQTTLLKTLEEPHENTYFIVSRSGLEGLTLPLLSRLTHFSLPIAANGHAKKNFSDAKRNIKKELEKAAAISKEPEEMLSFFEELELWIDEKINPPTFLRDINSHGKGSKSPLDILEGGGIKAAAPIEAKGISLFCQELFEIKERFFRKTYFNRMLLEHLIISKSYLDKPPHLPAGHSGRWGDK